MDKLINPQKSENKPIVAAARRSSLKNGLKGLSQEDMLKMAMKKRNSVSFAYQGALQFKEMFPKEKKKTKEEEEKNQKFNEQRRKSTKNEFSKVKDLLKNAKIEEIDDEEEEDNEGVEENTKKNIQVGKAALKKVDSDSDSSDGSDNEK